MIGVISPAEGKPHDGIRMHEVSIAQHLIELACQAAPEERILALQLRLGINSCVAAESLTFCFEVAARGTALEGVRLDFESVTGGEFQLVSVEVE